MPVVWNAPSGGHDTPQWARGLMEPAVAFSRYVAVRDEASRAALEGIANTRVHVVPDTAFGLRRILNLVEPPSADFRELRGSAGLDGPYMVIQAIPGLEGFVGFVRKHARELGYVGFWCHQPGAWRPSEAIAADTPQVVHLPFGRVR